MESDCTPHFLVKHSEQILTYNLRLASEAEYMGSKDIGISTSSVICNGPKTLIHEMVILIYYRFKKKITIFCQSLLWEDFLDHLRKLRLVNIPRRKVSLEVVPQSDYFKLCELSGLK